MHPSNSKSSSFSQHSTSFCCSWFPCSSFCCYSSSFSIISKVDCSINWFYLHCSLELQNSMHFCVIPLLEQKHKHLFCCYTYAFSPAHIYRFCLSSKLEEDQLSLFIYFTLHPWCSVQLSC